MRSQPPRAPGTALHDTLLTVARLLWTTAAGLTISLTVAGFAVALRHPELITPEVVRQAALRMGIVGDALPVGIFLLLPTVVFSATALFIVSRRSNDWMAMLFALMLLTMMAAASRSLHALELVHPAAAAPVRLIVLTGAYSFGLALLLFPNGCFVPRWTRWLAVAAVPPLVALKDALHAAILVPELPPGVPAWHWGALVAWMAGFWGSGVASQVYRYSRVSSLVERQQAKWLSSAAALIVLLVVAMGATLFFGRPGEWYGWLLFLSVGAVLLLPLALAVAVLRYRLWDIDVAVNRALVYGALTASLALAYCGSAVVLQQVLRPLTEGSQLAVAGSTLAAAALFQPLRRRIQEAVDRRFYRRKYDARRTLDAFSAQLAREVDLQSLQEGLQAVVRETVQPASVSLWLRPKVEDSAR